MRFASLITSYEPISLLVGCDEPRESHHSDTSIVPGLPHNQAIRFRHFDLDPTHNALEW